MGALTEATLDTLISGGCSGCGSKRFLFQSYLDARIPLMGGEPVGAITWAYDGEKFVDGVYRVRCADCQKSLFDEAACPRCHSPDALTTILAASNRWQVPASCPSCGAEEVRYLAMVPATVLYEGRRAERPRTHTDMHDPGFHGFRVDCPDCGTVAEVTDVCPLCQAPGPLRPRP
jgi:hypothetical protein